MEDRGGGGGCSPGLGVLGVRVVCDEKNGWEGAVRWVLENREALGGSWALGKSVGGTG